MTALGPKLRRSLRSLLLSPCHRMLNAVDPPVIVLLYHRVATLPIDPELLAVTPENFRAQLRYVKERFPIVRFEEDWSRLDRPAVAITFDDGYADNFLEALPIIEEVGVPATFFVTTGSIGSRRLLWWHELEQILLEGSDFPTTFTLADRSRGGSWPTRDDGERRELYNSMVRLMNEAEPVQRDPWLEQLRRWRSGMRDGADRHRAMTVAELQGLASSSWVTIGAHTVTHSRLASLPPGLQREEIRGSKAQLEQWLDREIRVFSYPFGRKCDYTRQSGVLCRESGFVKGASNFPGQAHRWTDPLQVPRHLVRDWTVQEFAARLEGFWTR